MQRILSANRLRDGIIVYLSSTGEWLPQIDAAAVFTSQETSDTALAKARADVAANLILDPVVVDVTEGPKGKRAVSLRNAIRALGPTVNFKRSSTAA